MVRLLVVVAFWPFRVTACKKTKAAISRSRSPWSARSTDTLNVPTVEVGTDTAQVTVPDVDVKKDTANIKVPTVKVKK